LRVDQVIGSQFLLEKASYLGRCLASDLNATQQGVLDRAARLNSMFAAELLFAEHLNDDHVGWRNLAVTGIRDGRFGSRVLNCLVRRLNALGDEQKDSRKNGVRQMEVKAFHI
jgi:hypothetical protein